MNADWLPGNAAGIAYVNSISALGRICDVKDIADIVGFLASHDGRWITGQKIDAAGEASSKAGRVHKRRSALTQIRVIAQPPE